MKYNHQLKNFTLCCLVFLLSSHPTWANEQPIGVVLAVYGDVFISRNHQQISAKRKTPLFQKDELLTGNNARAKIRFNDKTLTTLGENTHFILSAYEWKNKTKRASNAQFELIKGAFRTLTGNILDNPGSRFRVKTTAGSMGIRGTDFWGGHLSKDNVDVLLIDGHHAVEISNKVSQVLLEKPGQGTTLKVDQSPLKVRTWPKQKVQRALATVNWPE